MGRYCRDLTRLLRHFHIQSPILCCHSYGVPIGLEWARRHQVSALVAIASGTHNLTPRWEIPLIKFLACGGRHFYRLPGAAHLTNALSSTHRHEAMQRFFAESPLPIELHPHKAREIFWNYNFFQRHSTDWLPDQYFYVLGKRVRVNVETRLLIVIYVSGWQVLLWGHRALTWAT